MERQVCAEEGYSGLQEKHSPQVDECSYAEATVRDDEGALGPAEDQGIGQSNLCLSVLLYREQNMAGGTKWKFQFNERSCGRFPAWSSVCFIHARVSQ
jgi:hypothetical protein